MGIAGEGREQVAVKFAVLFPHLDERQQRLLMGAEARILGHGGVRVVARAAGKSEATFRKGVDELEGGGAPLGRVRRRGGGRKKAADVDSGLRPALLALVEPDMRGDPMSPLRWTVKSTRTLADELTRQGHRVCADTVGDLLREEGFSLQANAKTLEGRQHPDRDTQFRYINEQAKAYQDTGDPVISVDTKKKELVGRFATPGDNGGRRAHRSRSAPTTFPTGSSARLSRTGSTMWPPTPAGSMSVSITTRPRLRWSRCAAGGTGPDEPPTRRRAGCW